MTGFTSKQLSIAEEAADWFIRLEGGTMSPSERAALADWLRESPVHVQEFLFAATTYRALDSVACDERVPLETLLGQTVPEVVPLFATAGQGPAQLRSAAPRPARFGLSLAQAAGATFVALSLGGLALLAGPLFERDRSIVIATDIGEQKSVPLEDGSVVYLNTRSKVVVTFRKQERSLELVAGEALFKVAHDAARPFRVRFRDSVVEAVGTAFNVYRQDAATRVSVVEGKVAVSREKADDDAAGRQADLAQSTPTLVTEGHGTIVLSDGHVEPVKAIRKNAVLSWRDRRLVFEGETLLAIAREFNRYNAAQIRMQEPELMAQRFDGVFDANDPDAFMRFLEVTAHIRIDRRPNGEIWLQPSGR